MRGLVIHLLLLLALISTQLVSADPPSPEITYAAAMEKKVFQRILPLSKEKGILFEKLIQPPHPAMVKTALMTGKHALFQGVYGSFHISPSSLPSTGNKIKDLSEEKEITLTHFPKNLPRLIVGQDFAWLAAEGIRERKETRPVTPEDLGATFLLLTQKQQPQALGGRDVRPAAPWSMLVTHAGEWPPNIVPGRMKHRGMILLSPDGILENELIWNGQTLDKLSGEELPRISSLLKLTSLWWSQVMNRLTRPSPIPLPENDQVTRLNPNQWQRSCVEPRLPYMPAKGGQWKNSPLNASLDHLTAPGLGGCWHLDVPREGNYEIVFSLNPPDSSAAPKHLFKKGEALIHAGNTSARMDIMKGAEEIRIALDLAAGEQNLEINVTGQGEKDASLSVPYASIRYKGERIAPVINFQNRSK